MGERPEQNERPAGPGEAGEKPEDTGEAYSEDEEAAVAARLQDLGYI